MDNFCEEMSDFVALDEVPGIRLRYPGRSQLVRRPNECHAAKGQLFTRRSLSHEPDSDGMNFESIEEYLAWRTVQSAMEKLLLLVIVGLGLVSGCAHRQHADAKAGPLAADQNVNLDQAKVTEIARQAVAANDTWVDRAEFGSPARQADGSWRVRVWRLPKVPGGHRLILIDTKGRVTAYIRGA